MTRTICGETRTLDEPNMTAASVAHIHCRCEQEQGHNGPHTCGICPDHWETSE